MHLLMLQYAVEDHFSLTFFKGKSIIKLWEPKPVAGCTMKIKKIYKSVPRDHLYFGCMRKFSSERGKLISVWISKTSLLHLQPLRKFRNPLQILFFKISFLWLFLSVKLLCLNTDFIHTSHRAYDIASRPTSFWLLSRNRYEASVGMEMQDFFLELRFHTHSLQS